MDDVLVVGEGPSGLMMAAQLARYGLTCRLIDKEEGPSPHSRAFGIHARSQEIFDFLGLIEKFQSRATPVLGMRQMSQGETARPAWFRRSRFAVSLHLEFGADQNGKNSRGICPFYGRENREAD